MTLANIPDLVTQLEAALGDGRDCRSENEYATYRTAYDALARAISGLRNAPADLLREEQRLADLEARRAASLEKQLELEQAIAAAPDLSTIRDGRERDKEYGRRQDLQRKLYLLSSGRLLYAPGQTYEHPGALDLRIRGADAAARQGAGRIGWISAGGGTTPGRNARRF